MDQLANTRSQPMVGDLWRFTPDLSVRGTNEPDYYRILSIENERAKISQEGGRDPGFTCFYFVTEMAGKRWKLVEGVEREVTFNCPRCDCPNPIEIGDYVCMKCRALDLSD